MLTCVLHHSQRGYYERYFMGGYGEKHIHLVYGKLKPSTITLPLIDQITAGLVYQDLLVLGERGNTIEII